MTLLDSGVGIIAREEDITGIELLREGIAGLVEVENAAELYNVDLEASCDDVGVGLYVDATAGIDSTGVDSKGTEDAPIDPAGTDPEIVSVSVESDATEPIDEAAVELNVSTDADQDQDPISIDVDVDAIISDDVNAVDEDKIQLDSKELVSTGLTPDPQPAGTLDSAGGVKELK